jgi:hypothetical protein
MESNTKNILLRWWIVASLLAGSSFWFWYYLTAHDHFKGLTERSKAVVSCTL